MIEQYLTPGWITLAISLIGFISFYLGKIVLDFYPSQEDKSLNYIVGFILFLTYILIPLLSFYYFPKLLLKLSWVGFFVFWIFYVLFAIYFKKKIQVFLVNRNNTNKYFYNISSQNISKFGINLDTLPRSKKLFYKLFMELPCQLKVIILGYITIFLVVNLFFFFNNWIIRIFILIATIQTFNNIIILHIAKLIKYDNVSVRDINNKEFKGKLIKQDQNFIILNDEKNVYKFPRENIKIIHHEIKYDLNKTEKCIDKVAKWFKNNFSLKRKEQKSKKIKGEV